MNLNKLTLNKDRAAQWVFGFALAIFIYRYSTHSLVHQLQQPVLFETGFDYTYWIYHFIHFPEIFVKSRTGSLLFDFLLLATTLYCFITKGRHRAFVFLCAVCWSLYGLTYNSYSCHRNHSIIGVMVLPYAFLAKDEKSFRLVWDGFRYFGLYVFADAFFMKAFVGQNLFYFPNGVEFIKTNQSIFMLQNPDSLLHPVYAFFITHPGLSYTGFFCMVSLQGSMLTGFFTRKWDKYLFFIPIVFHCINYFFLDVFFFELLILNLTLLPFKEEADS